MVSITSNSKKYLICCLAGKVYAFCHVLLTIHWEIFDKSIEVRNVIHEKPALLGFCQNQQ